MQNPPSGFGALCAIHPDRSARVTCARCGNFMCDECSVGGSERLCPRCVQLRGAGAFPFDRNNVGFSELLSHAWKVWQQEWVMLSVAALIVLMVGMVGSFLSNIFQAIGTALVGNDPTAKLVATGVGALIGTGISMVVQGVAQLGFYRVCLDVLQGKKADVGRIFSQTSRIGRYIVQTLIVGVAFTLPALLYFGISYLVACKVGGMPLNPSEWMQADVRPIFVVILAGATVVAVPVMIWFALPLSFASVELVYGDCGALEGLRRAFRLADGFRWWLLGYGLLGSLIMMVGMMACCIGILPALALLNTIMTAFYMAVRNGSGLPAPVEN